MKLISLFTIVVTLSLSLHFNYYFPGGPGLAGTRMSTILDFTGTKDDGGSGGDSYKKCKAPVKM